MSAMELSRQGNSRPMSRTPDSSPERSLADENACPRPRSLPYRLKSNPEMETPDSSPEKEQGGVRLSPAKASSNAEIIPTTVLPLLSMERSLRHDAEDASIGSHEAAGKVPVNSPRSSSSDRGLRRRPRTGSARLPPRRLPPGFFPDASRSVSSPPQSAERTPLDGTVYDVPQVVPSPTRQHNRLSATQGSTERGGYIAQGSRGAPSTIQGPAERSGRFSQEPPPPYQRRRLYLHRRPPEQPHRLMPSRETQRRIQQWFRLVSLDISFLFIFLALTGVILLWGGLWRWKERLFPMTFDPHSNTWYGPVEYSYPQHNFIFGITITGIMIPLIPLAVILLTQYWIRSWLDLHAALFALKKAMVMMLFIQIVLKSYLGEFRPFFISLCNPDPARLNALRQSPAPGLYTPNAPRVFANPTFCRGDPAKSATQNHKDLLFAMTSFPSGHTSESFMAGTFLALYLNAKLKPFADFHTSFWKMVAVMAPVIGAMFVAGSLVADRNHHHHDILLSIPIGVTIALLAYRTHYASLLNYRTNHLPLPWSGSHESLNPTVPNPNIGQQNGNRAQLRKGHRNFAITDWPRKPKTYTYGNGEQEAGTAPTIRGLDGTTDGPPPAAVLATGLRSASRRFHPVRMGRSRLALFPRAGLARHGSSLRRSGFLEPNGRELFEMSPAVGPEGGANGTLAGRTGVDEWAARRLRTGRPSDMV